MDDSGETPVAAEESYDTAEIRKLIMAAFSDGEFDAFCFDYFRSTYDLFSGGLNRFVRIHLLIEDCDRHGRIEELLGLIQERNPQQYEKYKSRIYKTQLAKKVSASISRETVFIEIPNIQLDDLTIEQREGLALGIKVTLATVLGLSVEEVKILAMKPGSVILEVTLPSEAIKTLQKMPRDYLEEGLGIRAWVNQIDPEDLVTILKSQPEEALAFLAELETSWNLQRSYLGLQQVLTQATEKLREPEKANKLLEWAKNLGRLAGNIKNQANGALQDLRQMRRPKRWWLPITKRALLIEEMLWMCQEVLEIADGMLETISRMVRLLYDYINSIADHEKPHLREDDRSKELIGMLQTQIELKLGISSLLTQVPLLQVRAETLDRTLSSLSIETSFHKQYELLLNEIGDWQRGYKHWLLL
jgi:hypothetical protein